jgi:hypothetical protein
VQSAVLVADPASRAIFEKNTQFSSAGTRGQEFGLLMCKCLISATLGEVIVER